MRIAAAADRLFPARGRAYELDFAGSGFYNGAVVMSRELTVVSPEAPAPTFDVSVITVCFRALEALKRTVSAVAELKAENAGLRVEHVIVDGASTDGTPEWLAKERAAGHIETYVSEPDAGIYDAMNKAALAGGEMVLCNSLVSEMAPGGVSVGCTRLYVNEYTELMYRNRQPVLRRAAAEEDYCEMLVSKIFRTCIILRAWQEEQNKDIPTELRHLAELCEAFALQAPNAALRRAMSFIAHTYLPHLHTHRRASRLMWLRLRRHMGVITRSETNPYREEIEVPEISLGRTLRYYTRRLLGLPTE